jgi:hypothetical protein
MSGYENVKNAEDTILMTEIKNTWKMLVGKENGHCASFVLFIFVTCAMKKIG